VDSVCQRKQTEKLQQKPAKRQKKGSMNKL